MRWKGLIVKQWSNCIASHRIALHWTSFHVFHSPLHLFCMHRSVLHLTPPSNHISLQRIPLHYSGVSPYFTSSVPNCIAPLHIVSSLVTPRHATSKYYCAICHSLIWFSISWTSCPHRWTIRREHSTMQGATWNVLCRLHISDTEVTVPGNLVWFHLGDCLLRNRTSLTQSRLDSSSLAC